jgi:nitroreductase
MLRDLIIKNRSCRRFLESKKIDPEVLKDLIDLARLSPSGSNLQPLKYIISNEPTMNAKIFPHLGWAGYLTNWDGPGEGERPAAYILILGDTLIKKSFSCDHGIAAQSIMLGACEQGLRGCIIASINREKLRQDLNIPGQYELLLILALGMPREKIALETVGKDGSIKYWRDKDDVHHVPKRKLEDILLSV